MIKLVTFICLLISFTMCFSQDKNPEDLSFKLLVNTSGSPYVEISLIPPRTASVDIAGFTQNNQFQIAKNSGTSIPTINNRIRGSRNSIKFRVEFSDDNDLTTFFENIKHSGILLQNDLIIDFSDGSQIELERDFLFSYSKGKLTGTESQLEQYKDASGGIYAFKENKIEVGYVPKDQSDRDKTEFNIDFSYQRGYTILNLPRAYFSAEGFVSTNSADSLNYVKINPLSFIIFDLDKLYRTTVELGVEGTQGWGYWRYSGTIEYTTLLPNLINMSGGNNRLRLKPVFSVGLKLYSEQGNERIGEAAENENSNQLFSSIYYVVPVFEKFTFILDANTFYDFNTSVNPDEELKFNYQISFGYEIEEGFKTLLTYRNGETDINYLEDDLISLGILAQLGK